MFVNGVQLGAKAGLFAVLSDQKSLGVGIVMDLAYIRSYESDSRCFSASNDCNDTNNTAFAALSGALLF